MKLTSPPSSSAWYRGVTLAITTVSGRTIKAVARKVESTCHDATVGALRLAVGVPTAFTTSTARRR